MFNKEITLNYFVFKNKKWSTEKLLQQTLVEIKEKNIKTALLPTFNDIDTFEDLRTSKVLKAF